MKKLKKILAFAVAAMLCVTALAGCGGDMDEETAASEENLKQLSMPAFNTTDIDGNPVTSDILAGKDATVLHIWGTYCGPCVGEMPELGEWVKELPDNVQFIGLVCDISADKDCAEQIADAHEITEQANADFLNIPYSDDFEKIYNELVGVPTTIVFDGEGKAAEVVVGAGGVDVYKSKLDSVLNR